MFYYTVLQTELNFFMLTLTIWLYNGRLKGIQVANDKTKMKNWSSRVDFFISTVPPRLKKQLMIYICWLYLSFCVEHMGKPPTCHKSLTLSHNVVSSTSRHERDSNSQLWVVIGTDCTGSCKSTITTAPTILVKICVFFRLMMFHATFNNISVLSWWSVLFEEKTTVPGENHRPVASQLVKTYISYLVII